MKATTVTVSWPVFGDTAHKHDRDLHSTALYVLATELKTIRYWIDLISALD
jgi:hypothetical protein